MGRPQKKVPDQGSPLGRLATALRDGREAEGLSFVKLAEATPGISRSTLQRAASGTRMPKLEVVRAFAHACRLDVEWLDDLWQEAHRASQPEGQGHASQQLPVGQIRDLAELSQALTVLWHQSGAPSFRLMHLRAKGEGLELSSSTAHRICRHRRVPGSRARLEAFLAACGVVLREREVWVDAWIRARENDHRSRRHDVTEIEAMIAAGVPGGKLYQKPAVRLLLKADLTPTEPYRAFDAPWTVRCLRCEALFRVRLSDIVMRQAACQACPAQNNRILKAWEELLENRFGALTQKQEQALRASAMLKARLYRGVLEVPVFVSTPEAGAVLRCPDWHAALETAVQRHLRGALHVDVLLVYDYADNSVTPANGHRPRRLAKQAGLLTGPVETHTRADLPKPTNSGV
ncbi:helix-turn-helix transcriptional regulator [Streptomyces sp. NPDC033538]|uniref:helix-turn-helix domain-containing protein n=1 Tax=Streptomyces sp. NPDC033538 TaxID=3155367 RepID=UPI00340B4910